MNRIKDCPEFFSHKKNSLLLEFKISFLHPNKIFMKKNYQFLLSLFLFVFIILSGCVKENSGGCPDVSLLTNKWWYNTTPADSGVSFPSYFYESTGKLRTKDQDGTNEATPGTWKQSETCSTFNVYDSTMIPTTYKEEIIELSSHKLKVVKTWVGFGSFTWEYRDTP